MVRNIVCWDIPNIHRLTDYIPHSNTTRVHVGPISLRRHKRGVDIGWTSDHVVLLLGGLLNTFMTSTNAF